MANSSVHQVVEAVMPGDAVFNVAFAVRGWLRGRGYDSSILARHIHPSLRQIATPYDRHPLKSGDVLLYHYALGSEVSAFVAHQSAAGVKTALLYHNMTPARYFRHEDPMLYAQLRAGREELRQLKQAVDLAVAMSEFSRQELLALGYQNVGILPAVILDEKYEAAPDPEVLAKWPEGANLLFVGRIAPNKKQEDVIKIFHFYKMINPRSRLLLVGSPGATRVYYRWLHEFVDYLGLSDVHFCGHVSQAELNAYYKVANVFVSMSEHEGFGVPLIEAMHFGVPVIAFKSTAVPETLGEAGILVKRRDFPVIAEVINAVLSHPDTRAGIIAAQNKRLDAYRKEAVEEAFWRCLSPLLAS